MAVRKGRGPVTGRIVAALVVGVAAYYAVWGGEYSAFDLRRLHGEIRGEEARVGEARARADSLGLLAAALESDPATIERVARERFGMIRDGEKLYRFVPVDSAPAAPRKVARTP